MIIHQKVKNTEVLAKTATLCYILAFAQLAFGTVARQETVAKRVPIVGFALDCRHLDFIFPDKYCCGAP